MEARDVVFWLLVFIPSAIAFCRRHHRLGAVIFLNVLGIITTYGYWLIGSIPWLIAMMWSCAAIPERQDDVMP